MLENEPFCKSGPANWCLGVQYCLKFRALIQELAGPTMALLLGEATASLAEGSNAAARTAPRPIVVNLWSDWQLFGSKRVRYRHFSLEQAIRCADIVGLDVYERRGADPSLGPTLARVGRRIRTEVFPRYVAKRLRAEGRDPRRALWIAEFQAESWNDLALTPAHFASLSRKLHWVPEVYAAIKAYIQSEDSARRSGGEAAPRAVVASELTVPFPLLPCVAEVASTDTQFSDAKEKPKATRKNVTKTLEEI
jgi:hypothetical protein